MRIEINIPDDFMYQYSVDKFKGTLSRIKFDINNVNYLCFSGRYELELLDMLIDSFGKSKVKDNFNYGND